MSDEEKVLVKVDRRGMEESSTAVEWVDERKTVIWSRISPLSVHGGARTYNRESSEHHYSHVCHTCTKTGHTGAVRRQPEESFTEHQPCCA